jgi:hypothetical protein
VAPSGVRTTPMMSWPVVTLAVTVFVALSITE